MVAADNNTGGGGNGGFEFNSEGDGFGLGILWFHLWIWLPEGLCVPTSSFLPAIRTPIRTIFSRHITGG
jgi:hypothetical protein